MTENLTHRERLLRTLRREPVDRLPDYEFSVWPATIERWRGEGLEPRYSKDHVLRISR